MSLWPAGGDLKGKVGDIIRKKRKAGCYYSQKSKQIMITS